MDLRGALKKSGLVSADKVDMIEAEKTMDLREREKHSDRLIRARSYDDQEQVRNQERFYKKAAKEGTKSASNSGSKQYLNRFKK